MSAFTQNINPKKFLDVINETESVLKHAIETSEFNMVNLPTSILIQLNSNFVFVLNRSTSELYFKSNLSCDLTASDLSELKANMVVLKNLIHNKELQNKFCE